MPADTKVLARVEYNRLRHKKEEVALNYSKHWTAKHFSMNA
jgi:hypothetical protein